MDLGGSVHITNWPLIFLPLHITGVENDPYAYEMIMYNRGVHVWHGTAFSFSTALLSSCSTFHRLVLVQSRQRGAIAYTRPASRSISELLMLVKIHTFEPPTQQAHTLPRCETTTP